MNDKDENLKEFQAMLGTHMWIRQNEHGELESAPAHLDPPILFDKDIDPIFDGKKASLRQLRTAEKAHRDPYRHRSFYIQSIGGYDGNRGEKAQRLFINGFVPMRSKRSTKDGKCWEIWYLPGAWAAEGELRGKSEDDILAWICGEIGPGNTELTGEAWALSTPD